MIILATITASTTIQPGTDRKASVTGLLKPT